MVNQPAFIYGTAWKKNATDQLVKLAVKNGFKAIDTANQAKHYSEPLVGNALLELQKEGYGRENLFVQTKFTPPDSQDDNIPYNLDDPIETQIQTSFKKSLQHLKTEYVDSYLLHGPYNWPMLGDEDWQAWRAIETIYQTGAAKKIGVSNFNHHQLKLLLQNAAIKPMVVQNRCFATQAWDLAVRDLCMQNKIMYQGFSLLTANQIILHHPQVKTIAYDKNKTVEQIIFRFAVQMGITPLTGTTNENHMKEDLNIDKFELDEREIKTIETISIQ